MLVKSQLNNFNCVETMIRPRFEKFLKVMSELSQGTCFSNLKSVSITTLAQLAFNSPKFKGLCVPDHALFSENLKGVMSRGSLETCLSNLKSVTVSKLYWNNNLTIQIFYHRAKRLSLISLKNATE